MAKFNTLLLTSDNGIAKVLSMFLKQQGSNTSICSDTEEAIHMMQNGNYGLVIVDEDTDAASILQNYTNGAQFVFIGNEAMNQYVGNTITKPFRLNELLKYTKNIANDIRFRNSEMDATSDVPDDEEGNASVKPDDVTSSLGNVIQIGDVKFEPSTRTLVTRDGRMFKIPSEVQCEILKALSENGLDNPVNYETIFARIDKVSPKADGSRRTMTNIADRKTLQNIVKKMRGYLIPQGIDFRSTGNGYVLVQTETPSQESMNESRMNRIISRVVNESLKRMINENVRYDWMDGATPKENFIDDAAYDDDLDYETVYYEALHYLENHPQSTESWRGIATNIGFKLDTIGKIDMETLKDAIEDAMAETY